MQLKQDKRFLRDGKEIASSQSFNLFRIPEWSTHDDGFVSELLVIIVYLGDTHNT